MKIFVTGATGFIGSRLALRLANEGHQVHALYRDERKVSIVQHSNIKLFKGDILDYNSLIAAIEGCSRIYHAAAFAKVWDRDSSTVYRQNIEGTVNVIRAGINSNIFGCIKILVPWHCFQLNVTFVTLISRGTIVVFFFFMVCFRLSGLLETTR